MVIPEVTKLERILMVPLEERHICEGSLKESVKVEVVGVRIRHRADSLLLDQAGRVVNQSPVKTQGLSWTNRRDPSPVKIKIKQEVRAAFQSSCQDPDVDWAVWIGET